MTPKKTFNIFLSSSQNIFLQNKIPIFLPRACMESFIVHVFLNTGFWDWAANNHGIAGVENNIHYRVWATFTIDDEILSWRQ